MMLAATTKIRPNGANTHDHRFDTPCFAIAARHSGNCNAQYRLIMKNQYPSRPADSPFRGLRHDPGSVSVASPTPTSTARPTPIRKIQNRIAHGPRDRRSVGLTRSGDRAYLTGRSPERPHVAARVWFRHL